MKSLVLAAVTAAVLFATASAASAQFYYAPPRPIVPVVAYSYYPPAPVYVAPPPVYYAPPPVVAYYPPVAPAPVYGVYGARTTTYGLGVFRPRQVTTQYYYAPGYVR